jgi:alpha-tubulin suppressor-like RCC1 family protein
MALRSDGRVFSAGFNSVGELGIDSIVNRSTFVQATGISNAVQINGGNGSSRALRADGAVFGCGWNKLGELGDGTTNSRLTYVAAAGLSNMVMIDGARTNSYAFALRADGLLFAAGDNSFGQLGDGTTVNRSSFIQVLGISGVIAFAAGHWSSAAIDSAGRVFACGYNKNYSLGDGTSVNRSTFIQVI